MAEQAKLDVFMREKVGRDEKERVEDQGSYDLHEGWKFVRIDKIVTELQSGFACSKKYAAKSGTPHLRPNNVGFHGELDLSQLVFIPPEMVDLDKYSLKKGDVLFNNTNSKELVGRACLVKKDLDYGFSNHITRLRANEQLVTPEWLVLSINYLWLKNYFLSICRKWIGQAGVNNTMLKSTKIPLPPLEEQKRIVTRVEEQVGRAEEAKRLKRIAREEAEKIMQAALHKVFTRAEEGWKWAELDRVGKYINGRAFKKDEWETKGLPIIRIQNLTDPSAPFNFCSKPVEEKYYVKNGDLLISWSATLDVFVWNRGDALLNQHIFRVEVNEKLINRNFMFYAIKHVLRQIREKIHGSTMKHITKGKFENIKIPLPSLEEQKKIAAYLDRISETAESLNKLQQRTEEKLEKLVPTILDKPFSGKL